MASEEELREARLAKLAILKQNNINPYPAETEKTHTVSSVIEQFSTIESSAEKIILAGRVMSIRGQGKISFVDIYDGTATLQVVLKADESPKYKNKSEVEDGLSFFQETVDIGDFVEITGTAFVTQKGQQSLAVQEWQMLTKTILPIPDEHYGLKDDDERYRKRYLDILMDKEKKELFEKKAKFWSTMRNFLEDKGFIEVHTPTLETTTGGAEAEPFTTHHNDLDIDVHMRISIGELWQKRLMAAGFNQTYEIGRAYRNEGTSPDHLQEFTNMEFYWAYADYKKGMQLVQELYRKIAHDVFGTSQFEARGHNFDLDDEWKEINYVEEIKERTGIDVLHTTEEELKTFLESNGVKSEAKTFERLVDSTWKFCRKQISGPAFVIGYPDFMQPLAKRNEASPKTVEQFQILIGGAEIGKGYSELNDPQDQRERFEHQQKLREQGDEEAMMPDYDFLEMLEHGMPPTCGFGAGERLFAFLVDKPIREVTLFPLMKPKDK